MNKEDFDYDNDGIFTDDEAIETLRKGAEALGINPDLVAPGREDGPKHRYFAKSGCKHCYGRGTINVCLSPSKQKIFWINKGADGRIPKKEPVSTKKLAKRKRQKPMASQPKKKLVTGFCPGNELGEQWETRKKEPLSYKRENLSKSFCRCIRAVEI